MDFNYIENIDIYNIDIFQKLREKNTKEQKYAGLMKLNSLIQHIDNDKKKLYITSLSNSLQLKYMNLNVMARVIEFMYTIKDNINKKTVNKDTLKPYVQILLPDKDDYIHQYNHTEYDIMEKKMYATFFRYMLHLKEFLPTKK